MTKNEYQSGPPDPKDYSSLEAYEQAVKLHEIFMEKVEGVEKAINETKTEEQFQEAMKDLGYTCHEDEYCENEWCQNREECMAFALDFFQDMIKESCFFGQMTEDQQIITLRLDDSDCELPPKWKATDTQEGKLIRFCLEIYDAFVFENTHEIAFAQLIKKSEMQAFMRNLYFVLQRTLLPGDSFEKEKKSVEDFLGKNIFLTKEKSQEFLERFINIF